MKRKTFGMLMTVVLTLSASVALANTDFPTKKDIDGTILNLKGVGKKTVFFMDAFEVGYYQEKTRYDSLPLDNVAKHLEVRYFVDIPASKLFNFNLDVMRKNYSDEELRAFAKEISLMKEYFVDLKGGDCYELTYIPHQGTYFKYNGQLKGVIKGAAFAEVLFSVWLGDKPFDRNIKQQILSQKGNTDDQRNRISTKS